MTTPARKNTRNNTPALVPSGLLGKVPPQNSQIEEAILGAILLEKEALIMVGGILHEKFFYKEQHRLIYRAIKSLANQSEPIDLLTVTAELRKMGELQNAGGAFFITELTSKIAGSANIEFHTRILHELYIKRQTAAVGAQMTQMSFDEMADPFEIMEGMQNHLLEILQDIDNGKTKLLSPALVKRLEEIGKKIGQQNKTITGVDTGFKAVNALTGGWQKPDLIIVAARPAMGKTAFVLACLRACGRSGKPAAIFSLEMSESQLIDRIIAQETRLCSAQDLQRGRLTEEQFKTLTILAGKFSHFKIFIDDTAGLSLSQLRSKAYKLKAQHDIQFIVIDYLQLMSGEGGGNREQEISTISRGLKKIAKELDLPIIALSQLSRAVEQRGGDKRPQLSDLRESGAIEQDADIVIFLHRPEYYGIMQDSSGNSTAGTAEVIFAKHRNGGLDNILTRFIGKYTEFTDLDESEPDFGLAAPGINESNYGKSFRNLPPTAF